MPHILFLTTNNLATNPRLYKEIILAQEHHHHVTCVQFKLGNWSDKKSEELSNRLNEDMEAKSITKIKSSRTQIINLDATNKDKLSWLKWGLLEQMARIVYPLFKNKRLVNALASSRRSLQILDACAPSEKPDLIIAHNLGAAYPAFRLSQKWQIPFIFDVEDYHPGESIKQDAKNEKIRREYLMKTLLPKASAITSASTLIGEYTLKLIGGHPNHREILNSFPKDEFHPPIANSQQLTPNSTLRLVWFSQKISFGRGLEQLFDTLTQLNNSSSTNDLTTYQPNDLTIHLTLIGDMDPVFHEQIIEPFLSAIASPLSQSYSGQRAEKDKNLPPHLPKDLTTYPPIDLTTQLPKDLTTYQPNNLKAYQPIDLKTYPSINLRLVEPLSQPDLHAEMAKHDVGLALEPGKDLNNELAISNKIIAYAQAGLYILATDTPAQQQFMHEHPGLGTVCGQDKEGMEKGVTAIIEATDEINKNKLTRFEKGKELAWEKESGKLVEMWKQVLV